MPKLTKIAAKIHETVLFVYLGPQGAARSTPDRPQVDPKAIRGGHGSSVAASEAYSRAVAGGVSQSCLRDLVPVRSVAWPAPSSSG